MPGLPGLSFLGFLADAGSTEKQELGLLYPNVFPASYTLRLVFILLWALPPLPRYQGREKGSFSPSILRCVCCFCVCRRKGVPICVCLFTQNGGFIHPFLYHVLKLRIDINGGYRELEDTLPILASKSKDSVRPDQEAAGGPT